MKLLVDLYKTRDLFSGLGQYSQNFEKELMSAIPPWIEPLFLIPPGFDLPRNPAAKWIRTTWLHRAFPRYNPNVNVWHSLHQFPSHPPPPSARQILTVHDLNFLTAKNASKAAKYLKKLQKNIDRADAITVTSAYTGKILAAHVNTGGKDITTIHNGVRLEPKPDAHRPTWLPDRPFFFTLSVFKEQKNFHTLIPLMNSFPGHQLVIGGNHQTAYGERIRTLVRDEGLGDRIFLPGILSDDDKYWLYSNCRAFFFPSLAEGFGIPPVEAMLAGKPVFLSRHTCLPEIGGDVAFYWDTFNQEEMASVIQKVLDDHYADPEKSSGVLQAYASKYSWENCIAQFIEKYRTYNV